jgi:hypothetical protein
MSRLSWISIRRSAKTFGVFDSLWRTTMAKKRKRSPEEIAEEKAREAELDARVRERIEYHARKAGEGSIDVDRLLDPNTHDEELRRMLGERIAYHEAKAREEEEARRRAAG